MVEPLERAWANSPFFSPFKPLLIVIGFLMEETIMVTPK